ncbi:hypothetical protein PAMA_015163 [Pampus argenteus]
MAPKGGTFLFLLIVTCAASDMMPRNEPDFKDMAKKLMMKCQSNGYPVPKMKLLHSVFNNSDLPMESRNANQSNTLLSAFLNVLDSVSSVRGNRGLLGGVSVYLDKPNKMKNKMWNCTHLSNMIKLMRNSSDSSACYMQAFMGPLSWATLTTQDENNIDTDDYDTLLLAAKPALMSMPPKRMTFPTRVKAQKMKKMMKMLQEVYDPMSEDQRTQVVKWAKEQITENYFNCSLRPSSDARSLLMERCKPSLKWLNLEALMMMGPYLSRLAPGDVDSSPKEKLCEYFRSAKLRATMSRVTRLNPRLGKKFLQKVQQCISGQREFAEHVEKFGTLACYYYDAPDLTANLSSKLLSQISNCNNPGVTKLKKRLLESVMWNSNITDTLAVSELGSSVTLLTPKQLSMIPGTNLKEVLKNLGPNIQWTKAQLHTLVKKQLGNKKCKGVSFGELMVLESVVEGVPSCILKHVNAQEILRDTEGLKKISKRMKKSQLQAMLQGLRENVEASELVQKLPGPLLRSISLNNLDKANITSLDQVESKTWSLSQAAFLAKRMHDLKKLQFRRLRSVLQGITCKMIDKVADSDMKDLTQAIEETPQWLSKVQGTALSGLTIEDVSRLGPILCELQPSQLRLMAPDVLKASLQAMASCHHIPQHHRGELIQLLNQTFGDPSDWSADTMETLGPLLLLDNNAISALPNKPWMKDVLYFLKSSMPHASDALKKKLFDLTITPTTSNGARKKRAAKSNDNSSADSHSNAVNAEHPSVELIEELGINNVYWTAEQLNITSMDTFLATVEILGSVSGYDADQLAVLSVKATEAFGPVLQMNESVITQMGCIAQGFSDSDLEELAFSLDTLEEIAHCSWNKSQIRSVWKGIAKHNNLTARQLGAAEMVALNRFICGLSSSEIQQLNMDAFKEAVGSMDGIQCTFEITQQLKSLCVSAFGDPRTWHEAHVSNMGNIIAGLNATELASLDPPVYCYFSKTCIALIPQQNFAALSVAQLEALGPDNAAMVTDEQRAALSDKQLAALERTSSGSIESTGSTGSTGSPVPVDPIENTGSGSPSLSVEGISAFLKPLLFLIMGFLLL